MEQLQQIKNNYNITGIIAEYNPFHNGHAYHLNKAKELTNADFLIVVMSGDFVQRGEPAIINKYERAKAALSCGADLVIELPTVYSLSSAANFAEGAIRILSQCNVNNIVFGCECDELQQLNTIVSCLCDENTSFSNNLKELLTAGNSYPKARRMAIAKELGESYAAILDTPNNILGIEYMLAIQKNHLCINPIPLKRAGANYHDSHLENELPSATALRNFFVQTNLLFQNNADESAIFDEDIQDSKNFIPSIQLSVLKDKMPKSMHQSFLNAFNRNAPIFADDCSFLLNFQLENLLYDASFAPNPKDAFCNYICAYPDVSKEIANRIFTTYKPNISFTELIQALKTKQYTYTRLSRILCNILLDIKKDALSEAQKAPYIRILGFNRNGQTLLNTMKKTCDIPIITKVADHKTLLKLDIHAANIYEQIVYTKYQNHSTFKDEFRTGVIQS